MDVFSKTILSLTTFIFVIAYSADMLKFTSPPMAGKTEPSSYEKDLSYFKNSLVKKETLTSGYLEFTPKDPENIEPLIIWIHLQYIPYEVSGDKILVSYFNIDQNGYDSLQKIIDEK